MLLFSDIVKVMGCFNFDITLPDGRAKHKDSFFLDLLSEFETLHQIEGVLLGNWEIEHVCQSNNEEWDHYIATKTGYDSYKSSYVSFWVDVAIANCCDRNDCHPERILIQVEVLAACLRQGAFEYFQLIRVNQYTKA
jgi:hypothetical protein